MKKIMLLVVVVFSGVALSQSQSSSTPEWTLNYSIGHPLDFIATTFILQNDGVGIFSTFGEPGWASPQVRRVMSSWDKSYYPFVWTSPHKISMLARVVQSLNDDSCSVILNFIGELGFYPLDEIKLDSEWKEVVWDVNKTYPAPASKFSELLLWFDTYSHDSSYMGSRVEVRNLKAIYDSGDTVLIDFGVTTGVPKGQTPSGFSLSQNYPNPFNPSTTIRFSVPQKGMVSLTVFNLLGQEVKTLISEEKGQGSYEAIFNASNLPSGTYFYKLQVGASVEVKKMLLLK